MHRIGRTGRFGTKGIAISFITDRDLNLSYVTSMIKTKEIQEITNEDISLSEIVQKDGINDDIQFNDHTIKRLNKEIKLLEQKVTNDNEFH